jgi:hypothetical protein
MRARLRQRRGNAMLEMAMWVPLLVLLLVGMTELARLTYVYYTLQKIVYTVARYVGTQQGVNFCSSSDSIVAAAKNFAIGGTTDTTTNTILANLTADMIQVRIERYSSGTQDLGECDCSITGCDLSSGGRSPDFIVVSIPDGYSIRPIIPYLPTDPILFKPRIRVPFGGT